MLSRIFVVLLSLGLADAQAEGTAGCKCLGQWGDIHDQKDHDCNYAWAYNGKCLNVTGIPPKGLNWTMYPASYGEFCGVHVEPAWADCYYQWPPPPAQKPKSERADWCDRKWCYVDACNCDTGDDTTSTYWVGVEIVYSYATCGDLDTYTEDKTDLKKGNANCPTAGGGSDTDGAVASTVGTGLLLAVAAMLSRA